MATEEKLDMFKAHKTDYASPKKPILLEIASAQYLAINGSGVPGGEEFQIAIGPMYAMAFTIKMTYKTHGRDYTVCKLEAMWSVDGNKSFQNSRPEDIHYTLLIRTPDFIKKTHLAKAQKSLAERGKTPRVGDVRLETLREGKCVQMLHVGPYDHENETYEQMSAFTNEQGLVRDGNHHEIYISDPRRIPPERLKTILRFPVKKKQAGR